MITEEEINKILLSSPMVLPNSPADAGMSASGVKELFYKYIRVLVKAINLQLEALEKYTRDEIGVHNESNTAHMDMQMQLIDLRKSMQDNLDLVISTLNSHNEAIHSHPTLVGWIESLERDVQDAYNLASGKSKIYPVADVYEMLGMLSDDLNVGDKFVLATEGVPDFILFEKNSTREDVPTLSTLDILMGLELEAGKFYICNGFLFVATECGIDTSLFARAQELSEVKTELAKKENALVRLNQAEEKIVLQDGAIHSLGLRTSLELALPEQMPRAFYSVLTFHSGAQPTALASSGIVFVQDDCVENVLVPVPHRLYEIYVRNVEGVVIATVLGTDYEVIE